MKFFPLMMSILTGWVMLRPCQIQAQEIIFSDDFAAGLGKWQLAPGSAAVWSADDGQARADVMTRATISHLVPTDETWDSSITDFELSVDITPLAGVDKNLSFNYQDNKNFSGLHFFNRGYEAFRVENGIVVFSHFGSLGLANNQTRHLEFRFEQGEMQLKINDAPAETFSDPTFSDQYGKLVLTASTGNIFPTRVLFDNVVVRDLGSSSVTLDVTSFKQSDPAWKNEEYDQASEWAANTTLDRWGCALSSLAMIMNYHGLTYLPDGQELNPSTLNSWLKSQADGYVGQGLLNWLAGTRLTRLISERYDTPKLEYASQPGNDFATAQSELDRHQPVILQIPGHFLVGTGYTNDNLDLYINDPAYSYQLFSQHQTELLSTRTFQPSQTDLSYIMLVASPDLAVQLYDHNNQLLTLDINQDQIKEDLAPYQASTPNQTIYLLAKPDSSSYKLEFWQPDLGEYSLEVYTYDQAANPSINKLTGLIGSHPSTWQITYHKDSPSQINQLYTWEDFKIDLTSSYQQGNIETYAYQQLLRTIELAEQDTNNQTDRYLNLFQKQITDFSADISHQSQEFLLQQAHNLQR